MESLNVGLQPTFSDCRNILQLIISSTYQIQEINIQKWIEKEKDPENTHVYLTFKKKSFYCHKFPEVEGPVDRVN